jgi:phenylacetate-CoA ligase
VEGTAPHYQVQLDRDASGDRVTVLVEVSESNFFDQMKQQKKLEETIVRRLASELGVSVDVKLVDRKTLERFDGKARRLVDRRRSE